MHVEVRDEFLGDLRLVQKAVRSGVSDSRNTKAQNTWELWLDFCAELAVDPWFPGGQDPLPYLQVFSQRYRDGRIRGRPVKSSTVSDVVRVVGQTYKSMGAPDPRLDPQTGRLDFRLARQLRSYAKEDPPPHRVKPVPIQLIKAVVDHAYCTTVPATPLRAVADMICIAFFFLMRPGEYTITRGNTPFRWQDVKLFIGVRRLDTSTDPPVDLQAATSVALTFTTQKNGVKGEIITQGRSGDPLTCPVAAVVRRILHLREHGAPISSPLCTICSHTSRPSAVSSTDVSKTLRLGLTLIGPDTVDITPPEIDARSLRAGGATALLCANVDHNTIQLVGRWKSDAMLRYLHISANPQVLGYAKQMFAGGHYSFRPGLLAPSSDGPTGESGIN